MERFFFISVWLMEVVEQLGLFQKEWYVVDNVLNGSIIFSKGFLVSVFNVL